jgi:hypothetical protein
MSKLLQVRVDCCEAKPESAGGVRGLCGNLFVPKVCSDCNR